MRMSGVSFVFIKSKVSWVVDAFWRLLLPFHVFSMSVLKSCDTKQTSSFRSLTILVS